MDELNILYVDDDNIIRSIAKMTLQRRPGVLVNDYAHGKEAIEKGPDLSPDLILLDYMMPGLNGLEVMQAMRKNDKLSEIPVIFLTSNIKPEEIQIFMDSGAIGVISKPFDLLQLPDQVLKLFSDFKSGKLPQQKVF
jgi:two-component system OmpR family response regulator